MAAFFDTKDLAGWWQVVRAVTVARPLGMYAIEWESTPFKDEVLGRLGGTFHGTIIDYRPNAAFFIAEAYWQPPEGEPIGPMALEVHCRPHGNGRSTMLTVRQSGEGEGPRWAALLRDHGPRLGRRAAGDEGLHRARGRARPGATRNGNVQDADTVPVRRVLHRRRGQPLHQPRLLHPDDAGLPALAFRTRGDQRRRRDRAWRDAAGSAIPSAWPRGA